MSWVLPLPPERSEWVIAAGRSRTSVHVHVCESAPSSWKSLFTLTGPGVSEPVDSHRTLGVLILSEEKAFFPVSCLSDWFLRARVAAPVCQCVFLDVSGGVTRLQDTANQVSLLV